MHDKTATYTRKSIRLKGYDYTQAGLYFITICTQGKECLFGTIVETSVHDSSTIESHSVMVLNEAGKMIQEEWKELTGRFPMICLHAFVVMPNHFHAILEITQPIDKQSQPKTIGAILTAFKSITTVRYIHGIKDHGWTPFDGKLWQRNYYEHIIRNEQAFTKITDYILHNPIKWKEDKFYQ